MLSIVSSKKLQFLFGGFRKPFQKCAVSLVKSLILIKLRVYFYAKNVVIFFFCSIYHFYETLAEGNGKWRVHKTWKSLFIKHVFVYFIFNQLLYNRDRVSLIQFYIICNKPKCIDLMLTNRNRSF